MAKPDNILESHTSHIQTVPDFEWQLEIPPEMSNAVYCETAIGAIRIRNIFCW